MILNGYDKEKIITLRDHCAHAPAVGRRGCAAPARRPLQAGHDSVETHAALGRGRSQR